MNKVVKVFQKPRTALVVLLDYFSFLFSDTLYLKIKYYLTFKKKLNLKDPKTYSEKLQWLKLHDHRDIYTTMVDKYAVKNYVANCIGEEYIIPTLGVWDKFEDIDFTLLPNQFVLKCTHDSGGLVICQDKSKLNIEEARRKINKSLNTNYYLLGREWPYKNVPPRIICEQFMSDDNSTDTHNSELTDYKFFCFDGKPKALFIAVDRNSDSEETKFNFYDTNFNLLPFTNGHPNSARELSKPQNFEKMLELSAKLSMGIPEARIDFYEANGKVYFGEITFFHWSGFMPFEPEEWDSIFGSWIKLPLQAKN